MPLEEELPLPPELPPPLLWCLPPSLPRWEPPPPESDVACCGDFGVEGCCGEGREGVEAGGLGPPELPVVGPERAASAVAGGALAMVSSSRRRSSLT